jgi:hypothetical protein
MKGLLIVLALIVSATAMASDKMMMKYVDGSKTCEVYQDKVEITRKLKKMNGMQYSWSRKVSIKNVTETILEAYRLTSNRTSIAYGLTAYVTQNDPLSGEPTRVGFTINSNDSFEATALAIMAVELCK